MNVQYMQGKDLLYRFYRVYDYWLEHGAGGCVFRRNVGLCSNLMSYAKSVENDIEGGRVALGLMLSQFNEAGLEPMHPFNSRYRFYVNECELKQAHKNALRVEWVKAKLRGE